MTANNSRQCSESELFQLKSNTSWLNSVYPLNVTQTHGSSPLCISTIAITSTRKARSYRVLAVAVEKNTHQNGMTIAVGAQKYVCVEVSSFPHKSVGLSDACGVENVWSIIPSLWCDSILATHIQVQQGV